MLNHRRTFPVTVITLAFVALGLAGAAVTQAMSTAPGRIVFAVDDGSVLDGVDAGGASLATALPDGGALMFGSGAAGRDVLYVAKISFSGVLDRSFGSSGVTSIAVPSSGFAFSLRQVLRQSDGKLLLISAKERSTSEFGPARLQITRLNADATLDRSYGADGTAATAIGETCFRECTAAALQPDGAVVLTGTTGELPRPPATPNFEWAVTRLTPTGAIDQSFGSQGVATIPAAGSTRGFNVALGAGGTIVTDAQSQVGSSSRLLLTRLTSSGAPDPTFAGGTPVTAPFEPGFLMLVQDDGSIVLNGFIAPSRQLLARYTAAGAPDPAFGSGGFVDLGPHIAANQILPAGGHSVLVVGTRFAGTSTGIAPGPFSASRRLNVTRVAPNGAIDPSLGGPQGLDVDLRFGGGGSSFLVSLRPRPVGSLSQNSFGDIRLVPRADGSYLVAGGVRVSQPIGEGAGFSIGRFAAAALTPSFTLDTAFGGPATRSHVSIRLPRQRARMARTRHGIRVALKASAIGLARVKITHGGRTIANSLIPIFKTTRHTLPVGLTSYGNTYLRRHHNLRVSVTATTRDLLTNTTTRTARGRLR